MLSISHMATGALIATVIPNPILAVPLILASHYLEDAILHWDCGTGLSNKKKTVKMAIFHEIIDMVAALGFIYITFQQGKSGINWAAWLGSLVAIVPDLIEAPENFLKLKIKALTPLNKFHSLFHSSTPNMIVGLTPQLVLLFIIYLLS